jgi:dTDP-4-amino-4,6-dideoxygalactose transaminase
MIRLSKSCIGDAEKLAVMRVLDREYLGMGEEVQEFEKALSEFFGRPTVCVVNGTAALQLALQACGIGTGDEVLVQSLTYVASFQAISATGAKPIACDIEESSLTLNWRDAEKRLTRRTKAVMPVHYSGGVGALDEIYTFSQKHGLRVIEDAAHAFGTSYHGKRIGSFGDISCFSFDGIKNITSGEGGCVVTDDEAIVQKVQDARLLGVERDTEKRFSGERSWEFDILRQGWRFHMSNIMAAIGLKQLGRFEELSEKRQSLAKQYDDLFFGHPRICPLARDYNTIVPHIYVVRIAGMSNRNEVRQKLLAKGIQTGIHYQPNHWLSYFKDHQQLSLPVTDAVFPELLTLPLHPDLSFADVVYVSSELSRLI